MESTAQIISKITTANSVLVIVAGNNGDSLASGLALHGFLKKLEKEVDIISYTSKLSNLDFLQGYTEVKEQFNVTKSFVIDVSTKKVEIEELSYKKEADRLSIFIKPKQGQFENSDVTFRSSNFPFDLVILVGVSSLENLGNIYNQNTQLFFEAPLLNIDYRVSNENYAQLNMVNLAATSTSEIVFNLINQLEANLIDDKIATQLLAGIVIETDSFQHVRTTPQTFLKASQLVGLGANQQEIISRLYKSKSLGLLKLWGRVLARLSQEPKISLVYSAIPRSDIEKSQASEQDTDHIIKEMSSQLGFAKLFLFIKEEANQLTTAYFHSALPIDLNAIFAKFDPKVVGHQTVRFGVGQTLADAEKQLVELLNLEISKYNLM